MLLPSKIKVLLEYFKTVEEIYFSKNFNNIYGLSDKIKSSLADNDLSKAEKILEQTAKLNQKILVYDSESYPQILKNISSPPYVLYVQGKVLELDKVLTIGVVGTRNSFGIRTCCDGQDMPRIGTIRCGDCRRIWQEVLIRSVRGQRMMSAEWQSVLSAADLI